MRKLTIFLVCLTLPLLLVACGTVTNNELETTSGSEQSTTTILESTLDYIDENTTVTTNPDGTTTYTFENPTGKPIVPTVDNHFGTTTRKLPVSSTTTRKRTTTTTDKNFSTVIVTEKTTKSTITKPAPIPTVPSTTTTTTQKPSPGVTTTTKKSFSYEYVSNQQHTGIPLEQRYYYSLLNEEWKGYYRQIDEAVRYLDASVGFDVDISQDRKSRIYFLYILDTPELFFLANTMTISVDGAGKSSITFAYAVGNKDGEFCRYGTSYPEITDALREKVLKKKETFDNAVNAFISTIPASAPDVVKERMIYDKVLKSCQYNLPAANGDPNAIGGKWDGLACDNWTAYGIIINHTGVCESYAEAFQVLCNAVGIPCMRISNSSHAWSAVKIGGKWYQCDVTFDDPVGGDPDDAYHLYFNLTDEKMRKLGSRTWPVGPYVDEGYFANLRYPVCTATDDCWENFVNKYGE